MYSIMQGQCEGRDRHALKSDFKSSNVLDATRNRVGTMEWSNAKQNRTSWTGQRSKDIAWEKEETSSKRIKEKKISERRLKYRTL